MRARIVVLAALVGLVTVLPTATPSPLPGRWTLVNAVFAAAPVGGDGLALRVQTHAEPTGFLGVGSIGVALPDGVQVEDIATLGLDTYFESGGCGGGSPRFQLAVDDDGDGASDGNVFVYAGPFPNYGSCPAGVWTAENLLDGNARFDSTQFGGPFYGTQSQAQAAAGAGHQVLSATLVWDSTWIFGPSVAWFDELRVNCFTLAEPAHLAASIVAGQGPCA